MVAAARLRAVRLTAARVRGGLDATRSQADLLSSPPCQGGDFAPRVRIRQSNMAGVADMAPCLFFQPAVPLGTLNRGGPYGAVFVPAPQRRLSGIQGHP